MFLDELNGLTLESVEFGVNAFIDISREASMNLPCLLLQFGDYNLTVYNPMTLVFGGDTIHSRQPEFRHCVSELVNSTVTRTLEQRGAVAVQFSTGRTLNISVLESDYQGPEAIVFRTPTAFVVV